MMAHPFDSRNYPPAPAAASAHQKLHIIAQELQATATAILNNQQEWALRTRTSVQTAKTVALTMREIALIITSTAVK